MNELKPQSPLTKANYLSRMYKSELAYIDKIILFQEYHYISHGEIVILIDHDFPDFKILNDKKMREIIVLYEQSGWKVRIEKLDNRKECLLVFS